MFVFTLVKGPSFSGPFFLFFFLVVNKMFVYLQCKTNDMKATTKRITAGVYRMTYKGYTVDINQNLIAKTWYYTIYDANDREIFSETVGQYSWAKEDAQSVIDGQ